MRGDGRPVRVSSQYQASPSSMPPPTAPITSAASARSAGPRPASASASRAAASPRRSARARRGETPRLAIASAGTSAATRERKPSVSISVMGRMAQAPAASPAQNVLVPVPYGLTTPSPLTTTRLIRGAAPWARSRLPHLGEDEAREAVERIELLGEILAFLDGDAEPVLHRHRELDEVERVKAQRALDPLGERRLQRHVRGPSGIEAQPLHDDGLQLVEHFLLRHPLPFVMMRSATSPRHAPVNPSGSASGSGCPSCRRSATSASGPTASIS